MADILNHDQRHYNMTRIRNKDTSPERSLRNSLWHKGYRYRLNDKHLPGSPDIVLPKYRTVIFVHGCFWHGHKDCKYYTIPKTNTEFWTTKVTRNMERDQEVWRQLEAKGWFVIIVWECQLKKPYLSETVETISSEIRQNGESFIALREKRKRAREVYLAERRSRKEREAASLSEIKSAER